MDARKTLHQRFHIRYQKEKPMKRNKTPIIITGIGALALVICLSIIFSDGQAMTGLSAVDNSASPSAASGSATTGSAADPTATPKPTKKPKPTATPKPKPTPTPVPSLLSLYKNTKATKKIKIKGRTKKELKTLFYVAKIDNKTWKSMQGKSYHKGCPVKRSGLRRVRILYRGFDKKTHIGELITNKKIAGVCRTIFEKLYFKKYELERVQPIDAYGGNDRKSMTANNTSCFNHRVVSGSTHLSRHAYGMALDINPQINPYVTGSGASLYVSPKNGRPYADRSKNFPHKIEHGEICYKLFHKAGFFWGGDWITMKDYQHFQKS